MYNFLTASGVISILMLAPFFFYWFIAYAQKNSDNWKTDIWMWIAFAFPVTFVNYFVSQAWRWGIDDLSWPKWVIALLAMSMGCVGTALGMWCWFKEPPSIGTAVGFIVIAIGMAITIVWK